jgi:RHS repeat-associated protein
MVGTSLGARAARAQGTDTTTVPDSAVHPGASPQGICISCGPGNTPPSVSITPSGGTVGSAVQTFTIDWCDDSSLAPTTRSVTLNGASVTSAFNYTNVSPPTCGGSEGKSVGTVTLRSGANTIIAQIKDGSAKLGADTVSITFTQLVSVTPDSGTRTSYATIRDTSVFTVKNTSAGSLTYTLSTTCTTGWTCSAPASVTVAAGVSNPVNVSYTPVTSGTTGAVTLTATPPAGASSADAGTYHVTVPITVGVRRLQELAQFNGYFEIPGSIGFGVSNTGPTSKTITLAQSCSGTGVTSCSVSPNVTVAAGATELVFVNYTPGDSNHFATVGLTAHGGDAGNVAEDSVGLFVVGSLGECDVDTTSLQQCNQGADRTEPIIAIRPGVITQNVRIDALVVDWCDNDKLDETHPVVSVNGAEVLPIWPDSIGNTAETCIGAAMRHSPGAVTLLPGGNTVSAFRCDDSGNCGSQDAIYTYTVLDIATADSAQMRRGAGSTFTQKFRVTNIGHEPYTFTLSASCTGDGVAGCTALAPTADTLNPGASAIDSVSYQTPSTAAGKSGTVSIVVSPVLNPTWSQSGSISVKTITPVVAIAATPDSVGVPIADSLVNTYDFWVRNAGNVRETMTLTLKCVGVTSCTESPTSATLAPNDSSRIRATFTAGGPGSSGSVQLAATTGSVTDSATILVHAQPKDLPVASLDSVWAPGRIERGMCVTVAVGTGGTADECGDLRVAVAASAVRTLGETRAPTLLYGSSDATAAVVLPVWVSLLPQATLPDSITASVLVGGVLIDHGKWVKAQWVAGASRQVALAFDGRTLTGGPGGANDHSGEYAATVQVTAYDGAKTFADTLATTIPVVDRSQSAFGAGWWLAGLERLYFPTNGTLTWVGGDGSLRTYTKDPVHTTVYRAPSLARLDSLVKDAGGQYIRYLPNRLHVRFNSAGEHIATINRLGDSTVFAYNASGQLQTITVAPVSAAKSYTFYYDASGRLDSVTAPLGGANGTTRRTTKVAAVGTTRQVASLTLADGSVIQLTYDASHVGRILTSTDRRGTTTTFVYDSAGKVRTATVGMKGQGSDLITKITSSVSQGFRGTTAVDTAVVATRIDGPRTDVADTTVIRVTPFDAPRRITDALGHVTRIDHSNKTFPALVTHEHRLDAAASIASYDPKGHLTSETDSTTYVDDALGTRTFATTTYQWDNVWDEVTVIAPPLHDSTVMTYDPTTGNRRTQRDVVGDTVFYGYNTSGRLVSVRDTTHAKGDSLTYDALGNVASTITPLGFVTRDFRDATGLDTLVTAPIDSAQTVFTGTRTVYDLADRPTLTQSSGPKVIFQRSRLVSDTTSPETLTVATLYDSGGLVRRVIRKAAPDLANLDSLVTRMGYDPAGRKVADTATDGVADSYRYDAAGDVIERDTRNGGAVTSQYDALGELVARQMSGLTPDIVTFDPNFDAWAPSDFAGGSNDASSFTYDAAGRMLTADNAAALVHRSYAPNGELLTDSLSIATWTGRDYTRHKFALTHSYDRDARRMATHGVDADSIAYDLAGRVTGIQDAGHRWFLYRYDRMGRPDTVLDPNGARLIRTYDAQDRMTRRLELAPTDTVIHDDTLFYDARGKVLHSWGKTEDDYEGYSALGTLAASLRENTNIGPLLQNDERFGTDAMGNVVWHSVIRNGGSGARDSTVSTYAPLTGRITSQADGPLALTAFNYTAGGDRKYVSGLTGAGRTESQYYYRADGLLIAVDNRSCAASVCKTVGDFPPQSLHGAFEDYRYDALGRRVLVRTRKDSVCEGADCESSMMWVVFDGSAIAAEIRGPGADGLAVDTLEAGAGSGVMYGTVEYLNGPTLDEPLEIQGILPYRTWRGLIDGGQCLDGICGNSGTIDYPGVTYEAYLTVRPSDQHFPVSWHGSLFAEGQDDGGLMYRRNRYYDPGTGQFTQEDPLGLAGGLNAYGYANGDPVDFSDPFGLTCLVVGNCTQSDRGRGAAEAYQKHVRAMQSDHVETTMLNPIALLAGPLVGGLRSAIGSLLSDAVETTASEAGSTVISNLATKAAAREAVETLDLPAAQADATRSAISRATARTTIDLIHQSDGDVIVNLSRPGRNGFQVIQSIVGPTGAKNVTQYGIDAAGKILADPKTP